MGIKEYMNQHPKVMLVTVACLVMVAGAMAVYRTNSDETYSVSQAFYTDDDGATTFVDSLNRLPPFDHNGKQAVRAQIFTTDGGKSQFVGYLERYTADALRKLQVAEANRKAGRQDLLTQDSPEIMLDGTEVKKRGEAKWVPPKDRAGRNRVVTVTSPDHKPVDTVFP